MNINERKQISILVPAEFQAAPPSEKMCFIFFGVNANPTPFTTCYQLVIGHKYLASYWSGQRSLLPISWTYLLILRRRIGPLTNPTLLLICKKPAASHLTFIFEQLYSALD